MVSVCGLFGGYCVVVAMWWWLSGVVRLCGLCVLPSGSGMQGRLQVMPVLLVSIGVHVSRWYRAPELLVECSEYDGRVDVWSVGCIFAELLSRRPLLPGDSPKTQLLRIVKLLGTPSPDEVRRR